MVKKSFFYLMILSVLIFSGCLIKGEVVDKRGNELPDVTVTLSGPVSRNTITDTDGQYQFGDTTDQLPAGSYRVTPSKSGYIFLPPYKYATIQLENSMLLPVKGVDFEALDLESYDNFDSGVINSSLWYVDAASGNISIENGKAKFVLNSGFPDVGCNLVMVNSPETIKAIFVEITVVSYTGDAFANIWGFQGKILNHIVVNQLGILPQQQIIVGSLVELDDAYNFVNNFCSGALGYEDLVGNTYSIGTTFAGFKPTPQEGYWYAEEFGINTFFSLKNVTPPTPDIVVKGIGAVSPKGGGTCVVYFDNIQVLR